MVRKIGLAICLFLLVVASLVAVSALLTPVTVKTYPNYTISIDFINPSTQESLEHFSGQSDRFGEFTVEFSSSASTFDLILLLSKDKKFIIRPTKLEGFTAGEALKFEMFSGEIKQITGGTEDNEDETTGTTDNNSTENETEANETASNQSTEVIVDTTSDSQEQQAITGGAIEGNETKGYFSGALYIIILAVVLVVIVVLFVLKNSLFKKNPENFKVRKYSEIKDQLEKRKEGEPITLSSERDKELLEAEEKIKEAQEDIKKIKERHSKVDEAKKRFEEAKKELEKLQEEGSED